MSDLTTKAAEIRARLRAAIELGDRTGSRGKRPENIYNVADDALVLIEQQAAELAEARADLTAQIAGHRHSAKEATTLLIERKDRTKERDRIVAAGEELAAALSRYGFPMSDEAWRNTGDDPPASSQASVEARALHRAAAAFFREISGAHHE